MASHTSRKGMAPRKKKLKEMNLDEFMTAEHDSDSESSSNSKGSLNAKTTDTAVPNGKLGKKKKQKDNTADMKKASKGKKNTLANTLKDTDPDFYEYLQGEDKNLLNTLEDLSESNSDSEYDSDDNAAQKAKKAKPMQKFEKGLLDMSSDEDSDDETMDSKMHKLPEKLEVASDDSEGDEDDEDTQNMQGDSIVVTHKLLESWTERFRLSPSIKVLKEAVAAFNGAVYEAGGRSDDSQPVRYKIKGDSIFNGVVRLCLVHIPSALQTILKVPSLSSCKQPLTGKNNKWIKVKLTIKSYLADVLKLLSQLSDAAMINTILKHVHKLTILYISFGRIAKLLLRQMIRMWSTGEETTRVLAFLIINKLVQLQKDVYLENSIKKMYMAYVSNCKFVSPTTLPLINFMQRSLCEIFNNDESMSYQYAFVYIRQLAIHLRNAMTVKKKNTCQAVYNWQYIHCLGLWVQLLSSFPSDALKALIYPLTQTVIGTIKLVPSSKYYPLRFHCVRLLNKLSAATKTYIPTLPFLLDVFEQTDFNKKHKSVSSKPFNFAVILKFSKPQLLEKAFKDGLVDQLYEHLMDSYNIHAHSVGYPELIIPSLLRLKDFVKKCKIANYCKQIKQIIEKMEEQSKFMVQKRKRATLQLDDIQGLQRWEEEIESSPLRTFYTQWRKLRDRELMFAISNKEAVSGAAIEIPTIVRKAKPDHKATPEERQDFAKLFEDLSDSDDDENDTRFLLKEDRPKQESKKRKRADDDSDLGEDYSDFDDEELEQLAKSASEDEGSDGEDNDDSDEEGDGSEIEMDDDDSCSDIESEEEVSTKKPTQNTTNKVQNGNKKKDKSSAVVEISKKNQNSNNVHDSDSDDVVEDFALSDFDAE